MASSAVVILDSILSFVFIVLSIGSFIPQYYKILTNRSYQGISIRYVLLNAIAATEQFALGLLVITINLIDDRVEHPVLSLGALGALLNFAQLLVVWLCQTFLLGLICFHRPAAAGAKWRSAIIYLTYCIISLGSVAYVGTLHLPSDKGVNEFKVGLLSAIHSMVLNTFATILIILAFIPQALLIASNHNIGSLSSKTLAIQSGIFAAAGFYWLLRYSVPSSNINHGFMEWYYIIGWASVDYFIYAAGQAVMLFLVWQRRDLGPSDVDERSRLLPSDSIGEA